MMGVGIRGVGVARARGFNPSSLFAGGVNGIFYDISDLTTLFTTSAGTTQCAMPGQGSAVSVGRMLDKSGNGNHAIAFNDTTARPELRARVNLLTYSEEFDNGAWSKSNFTVTANAAIAPDGTQTADLVTPVSAAAGSYVIQTTTATNGQVRLSYFAKQNTGRYFVVVRGTYADLDYAIFDLQSGTVTLQPSFAGSSATISPANNGYYRCTLISSQATGTQAFTISDSASGLGSGVGGSVFLWGADLRPANIGANVPAYQRIADANTYDTSGFPLYLLFDGVDDSMYTPANLNLSGTDKVSVFAGVRRNTTATMFPVELSAQASANNGAFAIGTDSGGFEYFFDSRGTALQQILIDNAAYNAPVSSVATLSADIAAPSLIARINSTQVGTNTSSQGSGNYGTYPLYIGARNNASFFFNGHLHSLIIAGSAVSAGNISATEQWVAGKTGVQI